MARMLLRVLVVLIAAAVMLLVAGWLVLTQPVLVLRRVPEPPAVDPARLEAHVRALAERFRPRDWRHAENLDRAAAYIGSELAAAGGRVADQPYPMQGRTYRNVIAAFGPETAERVVVGAHYDAFGEFPGADDNASGVAGLLELARLLGREAEALPLRVELVAYALEETFTDGGPAALATPYSGSAVHAESLRRQGAAVRAMFSLEMIGYFSDAEGSQRFPSRLLRLFYPSRGDSIVVVGRIGDPWTVRRAKRAMRAATPLPVYSINSPRFVPGIDWSDHASYWDRGYPAVMVTDTAFYRNPHYHTAQDTPERLDYRRMALVVQGVHAAVRAFAAP